MSLMSNIDLAYAAGLFDGEGTVSLSKGSNVRAFRRVELSLSSTDKNLCELFQKILGGGHIKLKKRSAIKHHKQAYEYRWTGTKAKAALEKLRPYVHCPSKADRIDFIIDNYDKVTKRNGKYSEAERILKQKFEEQFFMK